MSSDQTIYLQGLLNRLGQGDEAARQELLTCTYERLRLLARKILHQDFPRLQAAHATGSVLDEAVLRLLTSLQEVSLASVPDYYRFAAVQMRRVLIDMARRHGRGAEGIGIAVDPVIESADSVPCSDPSDDTYDPARIALWTEFHHQVEALPEAERHVVDLHWYQGLSQEETAELLGVSQKEVSRRWIRARLKLMDQLSGLEKLL